MLTRRLAHKEAPAFDLGQFGLRIRCDHGRKSWISLVPVKSRVKAVLFDGRRANARLALAVIAILVLWQGPLRVLCEVGLVHAAQAMSVHHSGQGDRGSDLCCTSFDDRSFVNSATPEISAGGGVTLVVAVLASMVLAGFHVHRLRLGGAPPPSRSYYARSTRILR